MLRTICYFTVLNSLAIGAALACSCGPPPPPCEAYWRSPLVFIGTVTESLAEKGGRVTRARMRIDHAYRGVTEKSLVLSDDGMCDGPDLKVGEQYVMYTDRTASDDIPSGGCTRSKHVQYAQEDLDYFETLDHADPTGTVFGKVIIRNDSGSNEEENAGGALVEIKSEVRTYTATADGEGNFVFRGVDPNTYSLEGSKPGYGMFLFDTKALPTFSVAGRGCAVEKLQLRKQWKATIAGRLVKADGSPAPEGIQLYLKRLVEKDGKTLFRTNFNLGGITNANGEYSIDEVAEGRYLIVMNLYGFPTIQNPYPTLYWPSTKDQSRATAIDVKDAVTKERYDFALPAEPKKVTISGTVLGIDGKATAGINVAIIALPDGSITGDDSNHPTTDQDGHFSFVAFEGIEYKVNACKFGHPAICSADVLVTAKDHERILTLLLDQH